MPTISDLKWNMPSRSSFPLFAWTVPEGYKLLIKKAGIYVHSVEHLQIARMDFSGDYIHSFNKFIEEINAELSTGKHVECFIFNTSKNRGYEIGGWVMFDFILL